MNCIRNVIALAVAMIVTTVASAEVAAVPNDGERRARASLKEQAFDALRKQRAQAINEAFPESTRLSIYVSATVSSFITERVVVSVDGQERATRTYGPEQARALGVRDQHHRVLLGNIGPGKHRLHIDFEGRRAGAGAAREQLTGTVDIEFETHGEAQALIVPVVPQALSQTTIWRDEKREVWKWRSEPEDPRLGMSRYLRATGQKFAAMLELLDMAGSTPQAADLSAAYYVQLARSYLDFAMPEQARQALGAYADKNAKDEAYWAGRLRLAEHAIGRGNGAAALDQLTEIRPHLESEQLTDWRDLHSRALMQQARYGDAAEVLARGDNTDQAIAEAGDAASQALYMRLNQAVAMLRSGEVVRGRAMLDRVGRLSTDIPAHQAIRDRANLMLGYHFLAQRRGARAKNVFERVPLAGPYSNLALLGLGWAEVTGSSGIRSDAVAADELASRDGDDDPGSTSSDRESSAQRHRDDSRGQGEGKPAELADTAEAATKRALVAWRELAQRDPRDPAVQEAMVAIPQMLERVDAFGAAQSGYQEAVDALQRLRTTMKRQSRQLDGAAVDVSGPPFPRDTALAMRWQRSALADFGELRWLQETMADRRFHEALRNYNDLRQLRAALQQPARALPVANRGDGDLQAGLDTAAQRELERMQMLATEALEAQRQRLGKFLKVALVGVQRMYLRGAHQSEKQRRRRDSGGQPPYAKAFPAE